MLQRREPSDVPWTDIGIGSSSPGESVGTAHA